MNKHQACPKCPSSDAYWEYEDGHGFCFSCNTYFPATLKARIQKSLVLRDAVCPTTSSSSTTVIDTSGWTRHLRADALAWLLKYRLTSDEIKNNDIFWDTESQSLVFVIAWFPTCDVHNKTPKIFISRFFRPLLDKLPKYLTTGPKTSFYKIFGSSKRLILVEDVVSAIKVARTDSAIPLLGTSVNYSLILKIKDNYDRIDVWLDPDKRKESLAISLQLNQYGIKSTPIFSQNDPKTDIQ